MSKVDDEAFFFYKDECRVHICLHVGGEGGYSSGSGLDCQLMSPWLDFYCQPGYTGAMVESRDWRRNCNFIVRKRH